jgi:hypothetical protein
VPLRLRRLCSGCRNLHYFGNVDCDLIGVIYWQLDRRGLARHGKPRSIKRSSRSRRSAQRDARSRRVRDRFEARAIDKAGELLRQIAPAHGANQNIKGDAPLKVTREKAARDAGLSPDQRTRYFHPSKTILKCRVTKSDFEPPEITFAALIVTEPRHTLAA